MEGESMGVKASLQRAWEIGQWTDVVLVGGDHTEVGRAYSKFDMEIEKLGNWELEDWEIVQWTDVVLVGGDHTEVGCY